MGRATFSKNRARAASRANLKKELEPMKKIEDYFAAQIGKGEAAIWELLKNRDYENEFTEAELQKLTLAELKTLQHHTFFYVKEGVRAALTFLYETRFFDSEDNSNEFHLGKYCDAYVLDYHGKRVFSESHSTALLGVWINKILNAHSLYIQRAERQKEVDEANERQRLILLLANGEPTN